MATNQIVDSEVDSDAIVPDPNEPLLAEDHDVTNMLSKVRFPSCRFVLMIMGFLGFINVYCLRVNLSVALVAMVNHSSDSYGHIASENNSSDICQSEKTNGRAAVVKENSKIGEFNWDSHTQGTVLASFFYGYITTQVLGGWLAERFGGKILFGGGILVTAGLTLLTPFAARWSVYMMIALRVLEGIGEGVTFPSMHALLSCWIPPMERSRAVTFIYAGAQLGTVIGMPLSGVLCDHGFASGWPSVFYVFGIVGCIWSFAWFALCHNSPSTHPRISTAERIYIEKSLESCKAAAKPPVPWRKIAVSGPVWACAVAHFANNWGYYTLLTCLPKYMRDVLQFDMTQNGVLSGLPYVVTWLVMTCGGLLADWLRAPHRLQTSTVRKLFCTAGLLLPGLFLIAVGLLGCDRILIVFAVIVSIGSSGLAMSGYGVNHLDVAPDHAGTLMGLTNTLATVPGFVGPQVVGALTYHQSTRAQWQKVFYIATAIYCFGTAVFVAFGSGEVQDWAVVPQASTDDSEQEENGTGCLSGKEIRSACKID